MPLEDAMQRYLDTFNTSPPLRDWRGTDEELEAKLVKAVQARQPLTPADLGRSDVPEGVDE